jgi:MFS transporter, putative metabolite:H+ symporter
MATGNSAERTRPGGTAAAATPASVSARLDRLPGSWAVWRLVILLSLGGLFEFYDLFLTAYLSPGLEAAGIFRKGASGLFGLSDQATFAAVTFAGLFVGTIAFAQVADRFGRRAIFTGSLCWYSAMTIGMAFQSTAGGLDAWRFLAGIGIGVELVTIDSYIVELVPKRLRGRAFALNQAVQFLAVPAVGLICAELVPMTPFGIPGWRWVIALGAAGALVVWWLRRALPESPRWLAQHGRAAEADLIVATIEARAVAELGRPLAAPGASTDEVPSPGALGEIFRAPLLPRTLMLAVFNFFQTVGFYGFGNWVPKLIEAGGTDVVHSLKYSVAIALAYPVGPLLCTLIADRYERKWQIVAAAFGTAAFGLLFVQQSAAAALIGFGVLIVLSNNLMSYAYHAYQAELFPTRIRARAVGFVYSWSRLSTVFTSWMIGFTLDRFGRVGVFAFIAASMLIVCLSIGIFGPRTRSLTLEEIAEGG